jgi:hypothetical protein
MSVTIGETDYRTSGRERLLEAETLLREGLFAGAVYLAGRAVEAMLRALIWKNDPELRANIRSLDTGHDLRELLAHVRKLGVLTDDEDDQAIAGDIQLVGRLWFNNMRFVSTKRLKTIWWQRGEIRGKRTLKAAVNDYYDACSAVVKRCEVLYDKT